MAKILIKSVGVFESRKRFEASVEGYDIVHGPRVTITQRWRIQKHGDQKGKRAGPNDEYEIIGEPTFEYAYKPKIHLGYGTLKEAKKIASDWLLTQPDYDRAAFERKMAELHRRNPVKTKKSTKESAATDFNRSPKPRPPRGSRVAVVLRAMAKSGHRKKGYNKDMTRRYNPSRSLPPDSSFREGARIYDIMNQRGETIWRGTALDATDAKIKAASKTGADVRDLVWRAWTMPKRKNRKTVRNPSVGDYFHAAKRSASAAVRDVAAKAAAAAHAEAKRERTVTPEQALQTLAKSLGFKVVRGNPQKELRRYAVYRRGAHPTERPLWTGNATSGRHAQIQAERATGKDVGEARLMQGGSSLRRNGKFDKGVVDITHVEGVEYVAKYGNRVFKVAIVKHKDGGFMGIIMYDGGNRVYPTLKADTLAAIKEKIRRYILNLSESTYKLSGYANAVYGSNKKR